MCTGAEIGLGLKVLSAGFSVVQGISGFQAAKSAEAQAKQAAEASRVKGLQEANERARRARVVRASNIAKAAKGGRDTGADRSFINILNENERLVDNDLLNIRANAATESRKFELQAGAAKAEGTGALVGGVFGAAKSIGSLTKDERKVAKGIFK